VVETIAAPPPLLPGIPTTYIILSLIGKERDYKAPKFKCSDDKTARKVKQIHNACFSDHLCVLASLRGCCIREQERHCLQGKLGTSVESYTWDGGYHECSLQAACSGYTLLHTSRSWSLASIVFHFSWRPLSVVCPCR